MTSQPGNEPTTAREPVPNQQSGVTQHRPMRPTRMQGTLPPEVSVTHSLPKTADDIRADAHPSGLSRLDTARLDRRAALDLLAAEVSHELAHTLAFLRCSFDIAEPSAPTAEDRMLAQTQIDRLQRMLRALRQLTLPPPARERVDGLGILRHAEAETADLLATKRITLTWAAAGPLIVHTDAPLFQLLARDLLAAVVGDAEEEEASVGVQTTLPSGRTCGTIEVWTRTAEAKQPRANPPSDPWAAMISGEAALGLVVCRRIARTLGWELSSIADAGRNGLRLLIPAASFAVESER